MRHTPENPARPSPQVAALFPAGVAAAELDETPAPALLHPQEMACVNHCAEKRILDFTAGRLCARSALEELGIRAFPLLTTREGPPLWPTAVIGSITHTERYSAAVVARSGECVGLGLDAERFAAVGEELWPLICTPAELARLQRLPAERRRAQAGLIFAAKEAFFKCQFPLAREWIEFEEVEVEVAEPGEFGIRPLRALRVLTRTGEVFRGRFCFTDTLVLAAATLRAEE